MKKGLLLVLVLVVVGLAAAFFTQGGAQALAGRLIPAEAAVPTVVAAVPPVVDSKEINVSGRLVPSQQMNLSFSTSGKISEILVKEGEAVTEGQVIARLREEKEMRLEVTKARLEVMEAEKALKDLNRNASMTAAQLNYDIIQEQKELDKALKRRKAMDYSKATTKQIDDAYKDYQAAQEILDQVEDHAPDSNPEMRNAYNEAKKARDMALSKYNYLISSYTDIEKAEAEAVVRLHEEKINDLKRRYEIYSKGPDPDEVAILQARLEIAQATLGSMEAKLADLELRAPFAGTLVTLDMEEGQFANQDEAVVMIANLSQWQIETEDLTELMVTRIHEGTPATIKLDALPDRVFEGQVVTIKDIGETRQGDITYTAIIELSDTDPRFRWNMTSPLTIKTD